MPKLYLVRHAEPEIKGVLLGSCDPHLSETGKRYASSIRLPEVDVIYTSNLHRAKETALAIGGARIVVDHDLNEISYGEWDGLAWTEIEQRYLETARAKLAHWTAVTPPGGEEWTEFAQRIERAMDRIRSGTFPAAVVAHVTVNAQIRCILSGADPAEFTQNYGEVITHDF